MFSINCQGRLVSFDKPIVMGIINATPDSFYSGSRVQERNAIIERAGKMLEDGAVILDVGGQSTRPDSHLLSAEEECERVIPAIEAIVGHFPDAIVSVDSFYSLVAKQAVASGASVVNDVSGGTLDKDLIQTVANLEVPYILTHMKGSPQTMQINPEYSNVVLEVYDFLNFKIRECIEKGIKDIIIDPGFGFGKSARNNFNLLSSLSYFHTLGKPILVGLSRKASVYKTLGIKPKEALNGTTVLNTIALLNGANMLRVHDVKEAVEAIELVMAYKNTEEQ